MILECWCIVRWHHSYDCWAYIHRHLHQERKMYLKVCTDHNTVFIVFFRQTLDRAAKENLMFILLAHQQRQNYPSAATSPQKQRSRRPSWHWEMGKRQDRTRTSRGHLSRQGNGHQHATQPLQQDLGEGRGTGSVERRYRDHVAQQKRPQGLQQLSRDHAPVQAKCSTEFCWRGWKRQSTPSSEISRLASQKQIMYGQDRQSTHYSGAVAGVELPPLDQLHRLWEGLRQCGQRDAVEAAEALRSPGEDHRPHPLYLPGHELQYRSRRQKASRSRLESVKGACCHHFSSFWSSTGSWRPPQQAGTTGYSGHSGRSWMTSTLLMTWCSCHTTTDRCRKRTPAWRSYQLGQGSRSARRKQSWWRLTPLPTHQSQSVESPSGKWILSSTLGVQLTDRGVRTEMSQSGLARPEQLLSCSRTSGRPMRSGQEPNFTSSTPMWSQSCSTDAKLGGRQRQCNRCGASATSDGQRWSQMSCESERDRNQ